MSNIQFIEKEPWYDSSRFIGNCYRYPNYMLKDNIEYFMFNRSSKQTSSQIAENESRKQQLLNNGGCFFRFHGYKETPHEYIRNVIERRHTFEKLSHKEVEWSEDGTFCDFHGNLKEVSAAFHYRIYDKKLAADIEKIVGLIHKKKYNEALEFLTACENTFSFEHASSLDGQIKQAVQQISKQPVKACEIKQREL